MAKIADIRNGMVIDFRDELFEVVEFLHVKPGKGPAFMNTKLRNIRTGKVLEVTMRDSDTFSEVRIERLKMEYLYHDGQFYVLMDVETFEQIHVDAEVIGDKAQFMMENMEVMMVRARMARLSISSCRSP